MSNDAHIRAIVRAELRSLLARFASSLPSPSDDEAEQPDGMADAFSAWAALGGAGAGLTAAEAIAAGKEKPEAWADFCEAVGRCCAGDGAARLAAVPGGGANPGAKVVGEAMRQMRGRRAGCWRLVGVPTRMKSVRWRVARHGAAPLDVAPGRVLGG